MAAACGDDDGPAAPDGGVPADAGPADAGEPFRPYLECPGTPGCEISTDATLRAGAAAVAITPVIDDRTEILLVDTDGDGEYDPEDGDTFRDVDGDGRYDGIFIAGFHNGRSASGVRDEQWARAVAFSRGETTVVLVCLDLLGLFYDEVERIREAVRDVPADYVMVSTTHTHQAQDTVGIWGPTPFEPGLDATYQARVRDGAAEAVRLAVADLRPSRIQYASTRLREAPGGTLRYLSDNRAPIIIDDELRLLRFEAADGSGTISTVVVFGSHPEYVGLDNTLLSSDYLHPLREGIERGAEGPDGAPLAGLGGVTVVLQGAIGGQIGPQELAPATWAGEPLPSSSPRTSDVVGAQLAWLSLRALGEGGGSITDETAEVRVRARRLFLDVQNRKYHFAIVGGLIERAGYHWDPERPLQPGSNEPDAQTEIAVIDVGRAQLVTVPGELDPALFVGGYDGSFTPDGTSITDPTAENPPDVSMAPGPPYLRDRMRADAELRGVIGLGNDFLGYFVPAWNYELHRVAPYFDEAPGDHYEETNSLGETAWPDLERELGLLLAWPDAP